MDNTRRQRRGEYTSKRKKKSNFLKNTKQLYNYYSQKKYKKVEKVKVKDVIKDLKWWERVYICVVIMFKRIKRKINETYLEYTKKKN